MRSAASCVQGTTSSTHSGRAEITSIGSGSGASSASRTVSSSAGGFDRLVHVSERLLAHRLQQRLRRVVGRHDDDARAALARAQLGQQLEPVHARHPHVEEQQVEASVRESV